ncbi:putative ATP-dependent RNA helicase DHX57 [Calliphora vicina]|uniref:putative ATP-dependent RNA helicase DHX57 n=1 Tax=Calliphora vicina TaxID=7373 RepID=UPI00325BAB47
MDEGSQRLIDDCFLRPVTDARATNKPVQVAAPKVALKTEMQVLRLSDESQKMCMETLKSIHGDDFRLDDPTKYKDRGGRMKKTYWEDRGTLIVQSVTNYSTMKPPAADGSQSLEQPEDRLRRYALLKLENYGFAVPHCLEAYEHCEGDTDKALLLLFRKYMRLPENEECNVSHSLPSDITEQELLDMRNDEKEALESIYDKLYEEKEKNFVWSLKFKIDHLLQHSPSEVRKARDLAVKAADQARGKSNFKKPKEPQRCRNFDKEGTCKFANKCRFAHIRPEPEINSEENLKKKEKPKESDDNCFYLEIRFPPNTKYPYEAPYIYLKTTCHDIPTEVRLRIARKLYKEAKESCRDGIPCVFSISELLQLDESFSNTIDLHSNPFPSADKSLFYVEDISLEENNIKDLAPLPTHYEKGMTSRGDNYRKNLDSLEKEDRMLLKKFMEKRRDERYKKMMAGRQNLPAFSKMLDILNLLETSQVLVISGETGCGKSTQVPQFVLDNWFFKASQLDNSQKMPHVEVICTQPRRLSAIGVAERVADERAERIGQTVGYQIRLENKISSATRLTFCTTGILLRRLASEPLLDSVTHIIVDEVHERSEESDFLLMILKRILPKRPDLKVILMSATLNAKLFSDYFGNIPVLDIPGRTFPVEQLFLEDILERSDFVMECDSQYSRKVNKKEEEELMREMEYADIKAENIAPPTKIKDEKLNLSAMYARYNDYSKKTCKSIYLMEPMKVNPELIESVLKYLVEGEHNWPREGTILIFLPGLQEIQSVHEALCDSAMFGPRSNNYILVPLHSTLSSDEQAAVFRPAPKGKRKIVLSTNIAETSVTIDDCVFVIDYGLMKEKRFDSNRNMESLELVYVSRANANQRKGRAGRVMPGVCIHLYTHHRFKYNFLAQPVPEIHRVPLEQLVLRIKTLPNFEGLNVVEVLGQTLEPPTEENIVSAVTRLQDVGALDEDQQLTPLGHHLSALPVDVRIGKLMLFGAIFQCLDSILTIAACLSHKSPFVSPFNKRAEAERRKREFTLCNSDHLTCLLAYKKWLEVSKRNFFASRNYADEHFLSLKTLQTISEVKYQFLELLVSIGFVPINVPRKRKNANDNILELTGTDLNINGDNNRLLISLLCASLYPNIVKIMTPERSYIQTAGGAMPKMATARDLRFKTREDGYVAIHPSSVNSDVGNFQSPFLVYQEKVKTSRIFIRECSMLPLVPLVLFAGSDLKIELHDGDFLFLLEDGWIIIKAHNHETAEMIQCLRNELLKLLEEKIRDPCLNLLNHENGCKIIQNIVYLIGNNN